MDPSTSFNSLWPEINSKESARKAGLYGFGASLFTCGVTTLFVLLSLLGISQQVPIVALVDVVIFGIIAWRIYHMSRIASVVGLTLFFAEKVFMFSQEGFKFEILPIFLIFAYVTSIRGTFAYRKYQEQITMPVEGGAA